MKGKTEMYTDKSIESLKETIAESVALLDKSARIAAESSQGRYTEGLKPGEVVPNFGEYETADEAGKEEMADILSYCHGEVAKAVQSFANDYANWVTQPPSVEDAASVQVALSRSKIEEWELELLYDRYKDSAVLASAIRDRGAADGNYIGEPLPGCHLSDAMERVDGIFSRYSKDYVPSPEAFAESAVSSLTHVDVFGEQY